MIDLDAYSIDELDSILERIVERKKVLQNDYEREVLNVHESEYSLWTWHGNCPRCGKMVMTTLRDGFDPTLYCRHCGQKLKWDIRR